MIDIKDVEGASRRLVDVAVRTPLIENAVLNETAGGRILLKPECLQRTGSFKIRGAYNLLSQLDPQQKQRGVVAFSSGNHAQGVACAAGLLGIHAAIVMPEDAPAAKLENTRRLGGEVITYDRYTGDREQIAHGVLSLSRLTTMSTLSRGRARLGWKLQSSPKSWACDRIRYSYAAVAAA